MTEVPQSLCQLAELSVYPHLTRMIVKPEDGSSVCSSDLKVTHPHDRSLNKGAILRKIVAPHRLDPHGSSWEGSERLKDNGAVMLREDVDQWHGNGRSPHRLVGPTYGRG